MNETVQSPSVSPLHIVHTEASCGWGGQEIRILTEAVGMQARGHRVTLVCPEQAPIFKEAQKRGLRAVALPIGRKNLKGLFALRRWLKTEDVDVINTHSSTDSWLSSLARIGLPKPPAIVRTRHISPPISNNVTTRWLYTRGTDFIVTTGERLRETLIRDNRFPAERILSVPTGIDPRKFAPGDKMAAREQLGLPAEKTIIGIVATIRSWKGHVYLVEAIAKLNRPDILLLMVGDGPNRHNVERAVETFALQNQVYWAGNQENVADWLRAMDLFVLPSYANEGVPQSILQAMFCHLPVIGTPVGSVDEIVKDEKTGLMTVPQDANRLHDSIARMLDAPELCSQLADAGHQLVTSEYTLNGMVARMESIFEDVSRRRR